MTARRRNIQFAAAWVPIILLVAAQSGLAQPQAVRTNWDNVKQIASGADIRVELKDRGTVLGQFQSAAADSLAINSKRGQETLTQQTVARVWSGRKSHRMRNALIGLGIGAGAGLGVGAGIDSKTCHTCLLNLPNVGKAVFTPIGALAGGLIGFLIPTGGWQEVYRAQ
jgi:hypothetical protein